MPIAASYDGYSPSDPCGRSSTAHPQRKRKTFPRPPNRRRRSRCRRRERHCNRPAEGARVTFKEDSANKAVPAAAIAASIGEVGACTAIVGNVSTTAVESPAASPPPVVTRNFATPGVADSCTPLNRATYHSRQRGRS